MGRARHPDPEDVLAGRARVGARELLGLIHACNPTGRELSPAETSRGYALKARLQSLLVRRHRDEVVVERDAQPGVVGLRLRYTGGDACHALVAALDEDVRSWVQLQLDLGPDDGEAGDHD